MVLECLDRKLERRCLACYERKARPSSVWFGTKTSGAGSGRDASAPVTLPPNRDRAGFAESPQKSFAVMLQAYIFCWKPLVWLYSKPFPSCYFVTAKHERRGERPASVL